MGNVMTDWEILGIASTTDIRKIKLAYAAQAKRWHPEEFPEEFQVLQEAYKRACAYAKRGSHDGGAKSGKPDVYIYSMPKMSEIPGRKLSSLPPAQIPKERFYKEFFDIAVDPTTRDNLNLWEALFNKPDYTGLFRSAAFRADFVKYMCRFSEWGLKTLLFLQKNLEEYHTEGNNLWEMDFAGFMHRLFMERFYYEFFHIAGNSTIRNDIHLWEILFNHPYYMNLFQSAEFRNELEKKICKFSGWNLETLLFFQRYLEQ